TTTYVPGGTSANVNWPPSSAVVVATMSPVVVSSRTSVPLTGRPSASFTPPATTPGGGAAGDATGIIMTSNGRSSEPSDARMLTPEREIRKHGSGVTGPPATGAPVHRDSGALSAGWCAGDVRRRGDGGTWRSPRRFGLSLRRRDKQTAVGKGGRDR